jgi:hypothetical protein
MTSTRWTLAVTLISCVIASLHVDEQTIKLDGSPCVRLYNNADEGWVGCSTPRDGLTLAIMAIDPINPSKSVSDLRGMSSEMAVLLPQKLFTEDWLAQLEKTGKLGGLLVYDTVPPAQFSPAGTANGFNTNGNSFNFKQFSYPIVMVNQKETSKLLQLADKNKVATDSTLLLPTYKAKFNFSLGPTDRQVNSNQCLLWKDIFGDIRPQCQAIGGLRYHATSCQQASSCLNSNQHVHWHAHYTIQIIPA